MLESESQHDDQAIRVWHRLLSLAFVVVCVLASAIAFASLTFSTDLNPNQHLVKLDITKSLDSGEQSSDVAMPDTWRVNPPLAKALYSRSYHAILPPGAFFDQHEIYISAFRQTIEIRLNGRLVAKAGNRKINWLEPFPQPLRVPLTPFKEFRSGTEVVQLDLIVQASTLGEGGLAGVWYGPSHAVSEAQNFFARAMPALLTASIGILSVLMMVLLVDSVLSRDSRHRLLLVVPHLLYSLLCLPEIEFLTSLEWLKLYQVSINSIVLIWMYVGFYAVGILNRWLMGPMIIVVLVSMPYLFFSDFDSTTTWVYQIQNPLMGVIGLCVFAYFGWRMPDSSNRTLLAIFMVAGTLLCGAGINDISLNLIGNESFRLLVLPVAVLFNSLVLVAWTTLDMLQRNLALDEQQQHLQQLYASRTQDLENARSELMQHQRYQVLNTMGSAISHEIKNPLAALNNDLTVLQLKVKKLNNGIELPVERMQRTIQRIDNTISDLSDFSRRQSIEKKKMQLSAWLHELSHDPEVLALTKSMHLSVDIEANIEAYFDPELLRRAIVNVIENAAYALKSQTQQELKIIARSRASDFDIELIDNGPGFDIDAIDALCEPLVSGRNMGLGLGLAIVRDILHLHIGRIELSNRENQSGAKVLLRLPKQ